MGELYVGTADHADVFDDLISLLLQTVHDFLRDGQHRCCTERVTGMNAHRINILDEAYGDHIIIFVAHDFKFKLFPSENGFLDEHLMYQGSLKTAGHNDLEFFFIINETAAGTAHCVGRTKNDRVTEFIGDFKTFFHGVRDLASCHFDSEHVHGLLEFDAVFATLDRVDLDTDDFNVVFVQNTFLVKF